MNSVPCSSALAPACAKSHRIRFVNNSFACIASFLSELQVKCFNLVGLAWRNEAKMLRFVVGQYASALLSLKNVYVIVAKYSDETFLDF